MKHFLKICLVALGFTLMNNQASAQVFQTPAAVNPAAEADRLRLNIDLQAYHQGAGVRGSERGGTLSVGIPTAYGRNRRDEKYLFCGILLQDRSLNLTNELRGLLRYAMRFQVGANLFFSGGLAAGVDYTHIATDRLLEDGGLDPAIRNLKPNSVRFAGKVGVQLHNDRFAVGLFGDFPYAGSHVGMNARFRTNPDRKFTFEMYAYGYYYTAKKKWYGDFYVQGVIGRNIALGLGYDTDNYMQAMASLQIKKLKIGYACGFYNFSVGKAGINTMRHNVTLSMMFRNKKDRERD